MPWHETNVVNERLKFVAAHQRREGSMQELCTRFGISRKTGYKILERYWRDGPESLRDQTRAPRCHPNQTPPEIEARILRVRKRHPTWGSKKILATLEREGTGTDWPARSTVDEVLKRAGLVVERRRRRRQYPKTAPTVAADSANAVWSADYKGWFRLGDGTRCDPLTINDAFSRYSLCCAALLSPKLDDVKIVFEACFREYGLPGAMLTDNGPPFGSSDNPSLAGRNRPDSTIRAPRR
jgi:transposase InsO family protein